MSQEQNPDLAWSLRVSRRARYARLQIKPFGGLEVVIPPRFPRAEVPRLVARHADWARRQLERQARLRQSIRLPERLELAIDGSSRPVIYASDPRTSTFDLFAEPADSAIEIGASDHRGRIRELRTWIRREARTRLPLMLDQVSRRTGLRYRKVSIRSQKSRWGSCSARGNISLNDQLLFVPANTAEYLMVHELCHTRHLNHSRAFWDLVEFHCPDYRAHERRLGQSRGLVPDWFLFDLYA